MPYWQWHTVTSVSHDRTNCAAANDNSLTLMSAELIPRLEGGIRAVLDEADNM